MAKTTKTTKNSFKDMTQSELQKKLGVLQEEARVIRFKAEGSKSKNVKESGAIRKNIARILTEINKNKVNKK